MFSAVPTKWAVLGLPAATAGSSIAGGEKRWDQLPAWQECTGLA